MIVKSGEKARKKRSGQPDLKKSCPRHNEEMASMVKTASGADPTPKPRNGQTINDALDIYSGN